jgi:hypothetical protein
MLRGAKMEWNAQFANRWTDNWLERCSALPDISCGLANRRDQKSAYLSSAVSSAHGLLSASLTQNASGADHLSKQP